MTAKTAGAGVGVYNEKERLEVKQGHPSLRVAMTSSEKTVWLKIFPFLLNEMALKH